MSEVVTIETLTTEMETFSNVGQFCTRCGYLKHLIQNRIENRNGYADANTIWYHYQQDQTSLAVQAEFPQLQHSLFLKNHKMLVQTFHV